MSGPAALLVGGTRRTLDGLLGAAEPILVLAARALRRRDPHRASQSKPRSRPASRARCGCASFTAPEPGGCTCGGPGSQILAATSPVRRRRPCWWVFTVIGLFLLWHAVGRSDVPWSTRTLIGTLLLGWGMFNLVEGIIDHHILGIHHVNETVPRAQWMWWDFGFLVVGLLLVAAGSFLVRAGREALRKC